MELFNSEGLFEKTADSSEIVLLWFLNHDTFKLLMIAMDRTAQGRLFTTVRESISFTEKYHLAHAADQVYHDRWHLAKQHLSALRINLETQELACPAGLCYTSHAGNTLTCLDSTGNAAQSKGGR